MKSGDKEVWAQKKPPDNERLFNVLHQIAPVVTNRLLADAECVKMRCKLLTVRVFNVLGFTDEQANVYKEHLLASNLERDKLSFPYCYDAKIK